MSHSSIDQAKLFQMAGTFINQDKIISISKYGSGHINDSFLLIYQGESGREEKAIFQRINRHVFPNTIELINNIVKVTSHLRNKLESLNRDPKRETLNLINNKQAQPYSLDDNGDVYRLYNFVTDSLSIDLCDSPELFYESGRSFGDFAFLLSDFKADELFPTILNFHNTVKRFEDFEKVVETDKVGRLNLVEREVEFFQKHFYLAKEACEGKKTGALPLRVSHNDTKLNNVLFDAKSRKGLCVIDLDTVMPGSYIDDFGDSIRFGASTALEDERDLSKVHFDIKLFEAYAAGYLSTASSILNKTEFESLILGSMVMTYECGMRFLTDYLDGDNYFKVAADRPTHNLDRARTQIKLVQEMLAKENEMWQVLKTLR